MAVTGAWRGNTVALPQNTLCKAGGPLHGIPPSGILLTEMEENQWPVGVNDTETSAPESEGLWQGYHGQRPQMTRNCNSRAAARKRIVAGTNGIASAGMGRLL